ncbi:hypothetical protein BOO91_11540 [Vibrio navarrensis]|uniref:Uncharacterized protein n=1 Tax=Vibrio navarrensis TaxID=29495 RepID=A0AAJ4I9K5_9VIBR|nr:MULTISPECIES: hypothetical protein [Vibrio]EJK2116334.1 hypothetical protein [Vibrio navarrensis]KJR29526.1 hypothetical protein UF06_11245 [Vibrio sp. S234-5]MBE3661558.1 hypothetical protein [Vibrio navarrensis]MBE4589317.1 hypothetical protein [Vibrio navarrensis]MBE4604749.1 hypothetical protein [Vibrio navarrensis]
MNRNTGLKAFFLIALLTATNASAEIGKWYGPVTIEKMGHLMDQPYGNTERSKLFVKFKEPIEIGCAATQEGKIASYRSPSPNEWNQNWNGTWQSLIMTAHAQKKQVMLYLQKEICDPTYGALIQGVEIIL